MVQKIGILGSGIVGQKLAEAFAKSGREVRVGTRSPEKLKEWYHDHLLDLAGDVAW